MLSSYSSLICLFIGDIKECCSQGLAGNRGKKGGKCLRVHFGILQFFIWPLNTYFRLLLQYIGGLLLATGAPISANEVSCL